MAYNNINIKTKFKIIGAAEAAANLLCEFRIAEKKDFIKKKPQSAKVVDAPASSEEVKEESK